MSEQTLMNMAMVLLLIVLPAIIIIDAYCGKRWRALFCAVWGCTPNPKGAIRATTGRNCECRVCGQYIPDSDTKREWMAKSSDIDWDTMRFKKDKHIRKFLDGQYTLLNVADCGTLFVPKYNAHGLTFAARGIKQGFRQTNGRALYS